MRKIPVVTAITCGLLTLPMAHADVTQFLHNNACTACHQPAVRAVGPSWQEIAQRYGDGSKNAEQLGSSIKSGSSGSWGAIPMPAQAQLSDADATSIAEWILTAPHQ